MRCFYCGRDGRTATDEHIPSAYLGSRLKTRRVCGECNQWAGTHIDEEITAHTMIRIPRALQDVRNVRKQTHAPDIAVDGVRSDTGEAVTITFTPQGREAHLVATGELVSETVEVSYGAAPELWSRFAAKTALACAAVLRQPDDWLDGRLARALQLLMRTNQIDPETWPHGVPAVPGELDADSPVRAALGRGRHLIGFLAADDAAASSVFHAFLFGGDIDIALPLPGFAMPGSGQVWVLDWHPGDPPQVEDFDASIERMLGERGWDDEQINAARQA